MVSQILWCFVPPALAPRTPKWYVHPRLRTTTLIDCAWAVDNVCDDFVWFLLYKLPIKNYWYVLLLSHMLRVVTWRFQQFCFDRNLTTGECVATYHGHSGSVNCIRFHVDKQLVLTVSGDSSAHIWSYDYGRFASSDEETLDRDDSAEGMMSAALSVLLHGENKAAKGMKQLYLRVVDFDVELVATSPLDLLVTNKV